MSRTAPIGIDAGSLRIEAVSVAGLETAIRLPGLRLAFDLGVCPPEMVTIPRILFTHAHIDHMGAIVQHCATRNMLGMAPPTYVVPAENVEALHDLFAVWRRLDHSDLPCTIVGASPGDAVPLGKGRTARAMRAIHRVPSLAWAVETMERRRLPAWEGVDPRALGAARKAGVVIDEEVPVVQVAFSGDTVIDVIDREPLLRTARVLILECTFIDDVVSAEQCRKKGHVHLDELLTVAHRLENERIVLTHLSARYHPDYAARVVAERMPEGLRDRVMVLPNWRSGR